MRHSSGCTRATAVLLVVLIACPAWMLAGVGNEPGLPDPGLAAPREQQIQLGQKAMAEIARQMPMLPDSSPVSRYVQSLGHRLQSVIPQQYNWPYQFHVVQQKEINAFALPGGPVFVNLGTIMAADNEAELAGVIAHEMAHVYMQHSIRGMRKQGTTQAAGQILGGLLGAVLGGPAGALANMGAQIGAGAISMRYSRADESQADAVGAIIMYKAGYNPIRLAQFFQKLGQKARSNGPSFLSDHPDPGNRVQAVRDEIKNWPSRLFHDTSPEFAQAKEDAGSLRAYTAQQIHQMAQSGQIHDVSDDAPAAPARAGHGSSSEVMPSGAFQQFRGPFSVEYPGNWQPRQEEQSGSVTFAPPAGVLENGIAYGVVIAPFQSRNANASENNFDDATQQLIAGLQQHNPGMRPAGEIQKIRVNGILGRSVDLLGQSPLPGRDGQPQQERNWLVTLPADNGAHVALIFVAPENDFARLRPTFEQMLKSFHLNQ